MAGVGPVAILKSFSGTPEEYDPHQHRKLKKPTTYAETMVHCLKGIFGAGMLALPDAIRRMGVVLGTILTIIIGIIATYCIEILIVAQYEVCKKHKRGYMAYPKSMKLAVQEGPPMMRWSAVILSKAVNLMLCIWQLGICAVYLVFVGETLVQILAFNGIVVSVRMIVGCSLPIQVIFSLLKDLKLLTYFSTIANIATLAGILLVFFYLIEDDIVMTEDKFKLKSLQDIPIFIGITFYAMEAVGVILALEHNMEKPKDFTGIFGLFSICMCIIVTVFTMVGVFGYLKYGAQTMAVVTLNLPSEQKKAQAAKLLIAFALFLTYPLQNFVAWQIILRAIVKRYKPENEMLVDISLRVFVGLIPYLFALVAPSLGAAMGLVGSLTLSLVAVVFPAIMDVSVHYPDRLGFCNWRAFLDIFIILFGIFCLFSGVYTSLLEMKEKYV